jgi:hypothetical protein
MVVNKNNAEPEGAPWKPGTLAAVFLTVNFRFSEFIMESRAGR